MTYGVIVCTKCREHAQIIDITGSKTTRCQRCNAILPTRKLRIFFSSENLEEAISVRTQIQAQVAGNGVCAPNIGNPDKDTQKYQIFGEEINTKEACLIDNRKVAKKKKTDEIILEILLSGNMQMSHEELKIAAMKRDIDSDRFEEILKKMLHEGVLYSPSQGIIRAV